MSTSGTLNFSSTQSEQIIVEAYEKVGILPDLITAQKIVSAQRSLNLILSEWINRGLNLWTVRQSMLNLIANQNSYLLPFGTSDVLEATIRTSTRNLGGTAFSSSGVASNAFDNNPATACIETAPDGYIGYDFGQNSQYAIAMVGVQSNVAITYNLVLEFSNDNITWFSGLLTGAQTYATGNNVWYVIPVPTLARYFRIRETAGATLNIQELYFNTTLQDTIISRISRSEYISYPQKNQKSRPTSFYVDRQINPTIYIWPTPTNLYNNLFYTRISMMEDIGSMVNMAAIPQRFYQALCCNLALELSLKVSDLPLEKITILKGLADESFNKAAREDSERVPLRIFGDYSGGWGSV